jgi:antitoxin CptB
MTFFKAEKLKKLLYMSRYRGCKESEIIFGRFAEKYLQNLNEREQKDYEALLNYPDAKLMDWFMFEREIPDEIKQNSVYGLVVNCLKKAK